MSHGMEGWLLGAGLGASGIGGLVAGALADRVGKRRVLAAHRAHLLDRVADLRRRADAARLLPRADRAGPRHRRRVGDRPRHAGRGGRRRRSAGAPPRSSRRASRSASSIAAIVGYLVLPRVGWRAVLVGSSVTALLAVAVRASSHLPDRARARGDRSSPSCAPPRARPGCPAGSCARGCSGVFKLGTYWSCYTWLPTLPVEADAPEHRALADLDDHGAGRAARSAC